MYVCMLYMYVITNWHNLSMACRNKPPEVSI